MIVTKELAKQYLIKRAAWFIETAPDGDYIVETSTSNCFHCDHLVSDFLKEMERVN